MINSTPISVVDLVLTPQCNLSCAYCYQNQRSSAPMTEETLMAAIELLLQSDSNELWLSFYGGEPLLKLDLIQRATRKVEQHPLSRGRVRYAISTNGLLMCHEAVSLLAEHEFETQISFDGVAAAQIYRGTGSFEILDSLLDRLQRTLPDFFNHKVSVAASVLPMSVPYMAESIRYLLDKGVRTIDLVPIDTWTTCWRPERILELEHHFALVFDTCIRHFEATGRVPVRLFLEADPVEAERPKLIAMCGVDRGESLTVDSDGKVFGCVMFAESYQTFPSGFLAQRLRSMRLGPIGAPDFQEKLAAYPRAARDAEIFHHKERKYSSYGRCGECPILATCEICPVAIGYIPGNTDPNRVPDFSCAFNLVAAKYRQRFPARPT